MTTPPSRPAAVVELLSNFPIVIDVPVAWGEMDSFQHVNNIVYFRYFESARLTYFTQAGGMELMAASDSGPILASTTCRFRLPLTYPDTVSVGARVTDIGTDRFEMGYLVASHNAGKVAAEGTGLIVWFDYKTKTKAELPQELVERLQKIEGKTYK